MADKIDRQLVEWLRERLGQTVGIAVAPLDRLYPLLPEEELNIAGAVQSRRIEFSVGRWCARQALGERGIAPRAIPMGVRRGPVWPVGTCGSITHSGGLCAAVAAFTTEVAGLGIDVVDLEDARPALQSSASWFAAEPELTGVRSALRASGEQAHTLGILFCAKESALKAMSTKFDRFVEFTEIAIRFDGAAFSARCQPFEAQAEGWWGVRGRYCFTAAVLR